MTATTFTCSVLGAGGFLGTNLCKRLAELGHVVRAFGRGPGPDPQSTNIRWMRGDFEDVEALRRAVEEAQVVFQLIHHTSPAIANADPLEDLRRNVEPTLRLLGLCKELKVLRIVFASSGGMVYGIPKRIPVSEADATDPISAYGISKLTIEKYLHFYNHSFGLDYRILRVSNPFGPFQLPRKRQGLVAEIISKSMRGEPVEIWGDGSVIRDYVYVDDVIEAMIASVFDDADERIYNIGSGTGRSVNEVIAVVENKLKRKIQIVRRPDRRIDIPISILNTSRASDKLRWSARTPFDDGIEHTIRWWTTNARALGC